ncbi:hypothetical protein AB3329_03200 [Streptococcus sp. H31]|uniref:hypothetical protein n=1 Tax=Streptococcus huangxiaojuni TaxID=3237239 RepID=UPI0034A4298D
MTKIISRFAACLAVIVLLTACAEQKNGTDSQTASGTVSSSQATSSQTQSEDSRTSSSSDRTSESGEQSESEIAAINGLDTGRVLKGDYGTMAGSWENAAADALTFNQTGLTTSGMTGSFLDIDQDGVLLLNVETAGKTNLTLYIIPAGKTLSSAYFSNGQSDTTDIAKDRILSSQDLTAENLAEKAYYHITAE